MEKIVVFYKFTKLKDPESVRLWQKTLCEKLDLMGRIIISEHGINGTIGGDVNNLKLYISEIKSYKSFKKIDFKWSNGSSTDFPKLSVKVRDEIVTFGKTNELKVNAKGLVGGGEHLKPGQLQKLLEKKGKEVVFLDGRNKYEAAVGKFKGAIITNALTTKDFVVEIEKPEYESLKDKPIVTYCTGGVRCEVLSVLMKNRGFKEVYQLDGGIVKYGEEYGDDGLWEGSLYVFDGRMGIKFSDKAVDIGECIYCKGKTSRYINCANKACNQLILVCEICSQETFCYKEKNKTKLVKLLE